MLSEKQKTKQKENKRTTKNKQTNKQIKNLHCNMIALQKLYAEIT